MTTDAILAEVAAARREINRTVRIDWPPERWLAALGERVGGVCQAVVRGGHDGDLRACLVEVAAICGAWISALLPYEPPGFVATEVAAWATAEARRPDPPERWLARLHLALGDVAGCAHLGALAPTERLVRLAGRAVARAASLDPGGG